MVSRYQDCVRVLSWMEELVVKEERIIGMAYFFSYCLELLLYAGKYCVMRTTDNGVLCKDAPGQGQSPCQHCQKMVAPFWHLVCGYTAIDMLLKKRAKRFNRKGVVAPMRGC